MRMRLKGDERQGVSLCDIWSGSAVHLLGVGTGEYPWRIGAKRTSTGLQKVIRKFILFIPTIQF